MIKVDLTATEIPASLRPRLRAYLASLGPDQLLRLSRATPAEAARLMGVELVAGPGLSGYDDGTLGFINFIIQAAAAVYSANKAREKKLRLQNDMQRAVNVEIRAENERRKAIIAARAERDKLPAVSEVTQTAEVAKPRAGQIGAVAAGGIAILAGLVYLLTRKPDAHPG